MRDFGCVGTTVTTDFEALYAYKCGNYQRCLQLSTDNARKLLSLYAKLMPQVATRPEFIQLMDDEIVSLTALSLIINPESNMYLRISQLPLSLYLMTQCQLKLRHSLTSLVQTLDYIRIAQAHKIRPNTLDQWTLKLTKKKLVTYITA